MEKYTHEYIAINEKERTEFYRLCERRISLLKQHGFINEAILHAKSLRLIKDDLAELSEF
ncbi:Hypothetical protein NGAL_HAMBI2605_34910 [Neorhizobium galegae bv. orientalis]|nr:Hypothetical protein NGAL_HAMBI2605_34910 [Neorhizobium galegae bv. orientalis]